MRQHINHSLARTPNVALIAARESRVPIAHVHAEGKASTQFRLGLRTGVANNKVKAAAVGYEGDVIFTASATTKIGNKLSINSGNNQRGVVGQPVPAPPVAVVADEGPNLVNSNFEQKRLRLILCK